jgi:hypothetical protein
MDIATKEENVQRGIEPQLPTVPSTSSDLQIPNDEGQRVPLEVRDLL